MSSSGINAINSGPLIIRSYFGSSINNTYALGDYEIPISSNRVLITSTNGLVTPSDNIYVSSITISSINGLPYAPGDDVFWSSTSINGGIVNDNTGSVYINTSLQCSTITDVSTINGLPYPPQDDAFWSSTLSGGGIVNTNTGIVNISTSLIVNNSLSTLTIFDNTGSSGTTGQVLTAGTVLGGQVIWSSTLNLLSISTTSISTSTINGLPYPPQNDTFWASTLSNGGIVNTNTGNVGIGTTNPTNLLQVGNVAGITFYTASTQNQSTFIVGTSITPSSSATLNDNYASGLLVATVEPAARNVGGGIGLGGRQEFNTSITSFARVSGVSAGQIEGDFTVETLLQTGPGTAALIERMRIKNTGLIGIGTANPQALLDIKGSLSTLSIIDNAGSSGTSGYVLTAGTGGQVIWNVPAVSNYPYIWQYYTATNQILSSDAGQAGTFITWNGTTYEQPGYTGRITNASTTYSAPLDGWYQITFVGTLCGAVTGSQGDIPQGGTWGSFAAGLISQFTYGIRYNNTIVPGWQGYLNGYVVLEACGVQNQLVVIKYLSTNDTILVDNETPVVGGAGDFTASIGTTLTITYLRP